MVSCLILSNGKIKKATILTVVKSLLRNKDYEIEENHYEKCVVFIWNMTRQMIWQIVFDLEFSGIKVGYGFGSCKQKAKEAAQNILEKRAVFTNC